MVRRLLGISFILLSLPALGEELSSYQLLLLKAEKSGVSPLELEREAHILAKEICKPFYTDSERKIKFKPCRTNYELMLGNCGSPFHRSDDIIVGKKAVISHVREFLGCLEDETLEIEYPTAIEIKYQKPMYGTKLTEARNGKGWRIGADAHVE